MNRPTVCHECQRATRNGYWWLDHTPRQWLCDECYEIEFNRKMRRIGHPPRPVDRDYESR